MDTTTHLIGAILLSAICLVFMLEAGIVSDLDLNPQIENAHPQEIVDLELVEHPHIYETPVILYNKKQEAR